MHLMRSNLIQLYLDLIVEISTNVLHSILFENFGHGFKINSKHNPYNTPFPFPKIIHTRLVTTARAHKSTSNSLQKFS